jgi:hypothetical protein
MVNLALQRTLAAAETGEQPDPLLHAVKALFGSADA